MKGRIYFWFKGARTRKLSGTVDADFYSTDPDEVNREAENHLDTMITRGLVDVYCESAVENFGVKKVSFKFSGNPDFTF